MEDIMEILLVTRKGSMLNTLEKSHTYIYIYICIMYVYNETKLDN